VFASSTVKGRRRASLGLQAAHSNYSPPMLHESQRYFRLGDTWDVFGHSRPLIAVDQEWLVEGTPGRATPATRAVWFIFGLTRNCTESCGLSSPLKIRPCKTGSHARSLMQLTRRGPK